MKTYQVKITRDCRTTQSAVVTVQAKDRGEAEEKATELSQDDGLDWRDDDFFVAGEDGTYVADPDEITLIRETRSVPLRSRP